MSLPIAAKVRNGPRFAEVDAPVTHVAGAQQVPPTKLAAKKTARCAAPADLSPATVYQPISDVGLNSEDPRGRFVAWALEREAIRLRRKLGRPPPWTKDPILAVGRFCNVYREHDRVTKWITANVVEPHRNDPDLWFALTLARCINEPDALAKLLPHLLPFDFNCCREILEVRQARGEKVFRTDAYKPPTSPNKGTGTIEFVIVDVLGPMWRERESLRPQPAETLGSYSDRLEQRYKIGPFLAAQIVADLKHVAPLNAAADWWDYARPGPGSERGLNRVRGRPIKTSWSQPHWQRELMQLSDETAGLFAEAKLERLDLQNLQNCLCEFDKYERARDAGGKPSRLYKSAAVEPLPKRKRARAEATRITTLTESSQPQVGFSGVTEIPGEANERASGLPTSSPPEHNLEDDAKSAIEDLAGPDSAIPENLLAAINADSDAGATARPVPETRRARSAGNGKSGYPHGERDTGRELAFYIYRDARERFYLGVKRTSTKQFPQYHWDGTQWRSGAPKGPKIPYRLPELLDAPPDVWVVIAAGEKDAETAAGLGFVATTNPGGEGPGQWADELNRWFTGKVRVAVMEDRDDTGEAHAVEVANALAAIVPDIRIVRFPELKLHGDLTDWVEADRGRGHAELLARIEAAPADHGAPKPAPIRQWADRPVPEQEYTVPDRFPVEQLCLFSGEGAEGKSTIIQNLCAAHTLSRAWLGCVPRQGPAIYLECEDAESVLWRRLAAIADHYGVPIEAFADAGLHLFSLIEHDTILAATNKRGIVEPTRFYRWLRELAGDIKPVQIGIASAANVFAGNENVRTEVQQFAKLMARIAAITKGSIVLVTHPSLTGISATSLSHEGLSGTTQWHNAVRARAVIKRIKPKDDEDKGTDTGLRTITFHKNQYGPAVADCFVHWHNGLYLPVEGTARSAAERAGRANELTIILLQRFAAQNRDVSINRNPNNYAPTQFAQTAEALAAGLEAKDFKMAIELLLKEGVIENQEFNRRGNEVRHRLVLKSPPPEDNTRSQ